MGWIEKIKSIVCGLKASGKSEKEIEQIVQQAADKATVGGKEEIRPIPPLFDSRYMEQARMGMASSFGIPASVLGIRHREPPVFTSAMQPIRPQDAVDAFVYAVAAQTRYKARTESNNWRKMHGLPMRRKRRVRR